MKSDQDLCEDTTQPYTVIAKGLMVSHYRIIRRIGQGGMGNVYSARDTKLDRLVALKFISTKVSAKKGVRRQFEREAHSLASVNNHPNVVTVHATGEFEERPYIVMEFVDGESLDDILKETSYPINAVVDIAVQVSEGLAAVHDQGVVHRDLKPSNIIIVNNSLKPKIIDFGLVDVEGEKNIENFENPEATLYYNSPEQVQGRKVGIQSDLFSLGIILYEMITGQKPFVGYSVKAIKKAICQKEHRPLKDFDPRVPDRLEYIVGRLLEKKPECRYASAKEVIADLKQLEKDVGFKDYDRWQKKNRRLKKMRGLAFVTAIFAGLITILLLITDGDQGIAVKKFKVYIMPVKLSGTENDGALGDGFQKMLHKNLLNRYEGNDTLAFALKFQDNLDPAASKTLIDSGVVIYCLRVNIAWKGSDGTRRADLDAVFHKHGDDNYQHHITDTFSGITEEEPNADTEFWITISQEIDRYLTKEKKSYFPSISLPQKPDDMVEKTKSETEKIIYRSTNDFREPVQSDKR